ncbi:hypothetical protein Y1Q_0007125 [Alligator mississippiensis]|uniref:Uncharacterized protein n=1 Tax=Alligator mississippiensis TaxID=8496 RepID=A0A151N5N9_ALLMI|nr:hypothetical protein Y1Q_0007125 [Alligator mississippiensis]
MQATGKGPDKGMVEKMEKGEQERHLMSETVSGGDAGRKRSLSRREKLNPREPSQEPSPPGAVWWEKQVVLKPLRKAPRRISGRSKLSLPQVDYIGLQNRSVAVCHVLCSLVKCDHSWS